MLNSASNERVIAMTIECVYFDKVAHKLTVNQNFKGVQDLVLNLCPQMQQLVPNRPDLHSVTSEDDVMNCKLITYDIFWSFKKDSKKIPLSSH